MGTQDKKMAMMKDLNKLGKEYVDELFLLGMGAFLWQLYLNTTAGRAGIQGIFTTTGIGLALIAVGWILIIIPEPATTLTGIVMVGIGLTMVGGMITYLSNLLGGFFNNPAILIGAVGILLLFLYIKNRPRKTPIVYYPQQRGRR